MVRNPSSSTKVVVNSILGLRTKIHGPHIRARNIQMGWGQRLILGKTLGFQLEVTLKQKPIRFRSYGSGKTSYRLG